MKLDVKNFSGKLLFDYEIRLEKKPDEEYPSVVMYINRHGQEKEMHDLVMGFEGITYKEKVLDAYKRAEKKWGIQLIKEEELTDVIAR